MKTHRRLLMTAAACSWMSACTTFTQGDLDRDELVQAGAPVVMQAGKTTPEVSPRDRQGWLEQRQAKGITPRLNGTLATGEAEAAISLAKARLAQSPGDAQALTMLAAALVMTHSYELAAYYAQLLEEVQPNSPYALNVKGLAKVMAPHSRLADYQMAQQYFQQALDADASQIAPGLNLGYLQLELGNAAAAAQTFKTVAVRCHDCVAGLMGEGIALARSRQYGQAQIAFNKVLSKHPKHATAMYNLALVYKNGYHDKTKAESYLTAVLHDVRTKDKPLREKAMVVLRMLKGEAPSDERTMIADSPEADQQAAEVMMTGAINNPSSEDEP